jgi:hypothetical protein
MKITDFFRRIFGGPPICRWCLTHAASADGFCSDWCMREFDRPMYAVDEGGSD